MSALTMPDAYTATKLRRRGLFLEV